MNSLHTTHYSLLTRKKGQVALSLVFLIGGISLLVAITLSLVAISFLNSTFAFQSANKAMALAVSGAEDALLRLARDSTFRAASPYSVCPTTDCAAVTLSGGSAGPVTIDSVATVSSAQRKVEVMATVDSRTSVVSVASFQVLTQ